MVRRSPVTPDNFAELLAWLNPDREIASAIYLQLRTDLEQIFYWRHCLDPQGLTDEVIDCVAGKLAEVKTTYEGDPRLYFYGVARNFDKRVSSKANLRVSLDEIDLQSLVFAEGETSSDEREECLQTCLKQLDQDKRELIIDYYAREKQAKIDARAAMAKRLGVTTETLRVRAFRIRAVLQKCIYECLRRLGPAQ